MGDTLSRLLIILIESTNDKNLKKKIYTEKLKKIYTEKLKNLHREPEHADTDRIDPSACIEGHAHGRSLSRVLDASANKLYIYGRSMLRSMP